METLQLKTESYLFKQSNSQFRAFPFYELSLDEWIIFEDGLPKYFLDFNNRTAPLINAIRKKLQLGENLNEVVKNIGVFLGKNWTINHNIVGEEIKNSEKRETVEIYVLTDLSDLFMDLYFVAPDYIDLAELTNEDKLFEKYLNNGNGIQSSFIDNLDNLNVILTFIFKTEFKFEKIYEKMDKTIYNLTKFKDKTIEIEEFDSNYENVLNQIQRDNSMNEYGNLLEIITYIKKYSFKSNLILITEKRKHYG